VEAFQQPLIKYSGEPSSKQLISAKSAYRQLL